MNLNANTRAELRRHMIGLVDELSEQYDIVASWSEIPKPFHQLDQGTLVIQLTFSPRKEEI